MPRYKARVALPDNARMAGQMQGPKAGIVSKLVKPWVDVKPQEVPHLPASTMYLGKSEADYLDAAHELKLKIIKDAPNGGVPDLLNSLVSDYGYDRAEALKTINKTLNNKTGQLHQVAVGVPNAQADEQVSQAALLFDGWDNVRFGNGDPVEGTDLIGKLNGNEFNIDAQSRYTYNGNLRIGLLQNVNGLNKALDDLYNSRNVGEGFNKVMNGGYKAFEDKLGQTIDYEMRHSNKFVDNRHEFNKDLLISPNRRMQGRRPTPVAGPDGHIRDFREHHGTYDRSLPSYFDLLDLNAIRNDVFNNRADNLPNGMSIEDPYRGQTSGKVVLNVPVESLNKYRFNDKDMSDEVFKGLIAKERQSRSI